MEAAYRVADLIAFARALFAAAGCDGDKPDALAEALVEGELLGHDTHGLQLCGPYLEELAAGAMRATGAPETVRDGGPAVVWDGRRLPGPWLVRTAVDLALERAARYGMAAVAIRRSHHIACLAAFLERATAQGMMIQIACSDPGDACVAPFGGTAPVFTPDPIAVGLPTGGDPILIDISASITTAGLSARLAREGRRYPGKWAMDAAGAETDDPRVLAADPPGTLLPVGGRDHGHKGYGLALTVEALTQGLSGFGRAERPAGWGAAVFVQVLDPEAFGGRAAFEREMGWIAAACRTSPPVPGAAAVRLPGERALARKRAALRDGLRPYAGTMEPLASWARTLRVAMPMPIA